MKKILSIVLAMLMVLSLAACGGKGNGSDAGGDKAETIVFGKYTAVFKGYELTKDEDGRDALCLTYDYTNGSKEEQSFAWAFLYEATQCGEDLDFPGFDENGEKLEKNLEEKIGKGQTIEVKIGIALVNTTDDVTIHFSDFDDHEYTQTIKLPDSGEKETGSAEGGPKEAGSYKLYEMTFEGETFDNAFLESGGMDKLYTLELAADGTGLMTIDGDESSVTWKDGKLTVDLSGAEYTYEYRDELLTLQETTGDTMVFQKTGTAGGSTGQKPADGGETTEPENQTAFQEYWNGDWFGWMVCSNGTNESADWDGLYWDCMAKIEIDENGEGGMIIWDETTSVDDPMIGVMISVSDGGFPQGRLKSEEGWFWDCEIGNADWLVDPDGLGYEHLILIEGTYTDPEDSFSHFDYHIYLRPWGLDWADIEEEQPDGLPTYYYDWYLPAIQAGAAMPDVIGGDYGGTASGEVPDNQTEGQPAGDLAPISYTELLGVVVPTGFSYNDGWFCYSDSDFTVAIWLSDAQTFTSDSEFQSALSLKTVTKTLTLGGYTVYMCEDPENFMGPSTLYYVELGGEGGCAGCRITVSSMADDISATQSQAILDMIASISALR